MLLMALLAGVYLHSYGSGVIPSATSRQLQLRAGYLYRTLELSQVENYSLSFFQSIAENLIEVGESTVPAAVIENQLSAVLEFLKPSGFGIRVELIYENQTWVQSSPDYSAPSGEEYTFSGKLTIVVAEAENRVAQISAQISLYRL